MSAFLCSPLHTVAVALFAVKTGTAAPGAEVVKTAQGLRRLNSYALACRYGDKAKPLSRRVVLQVQDKAQQWLDSASPAGVAAICHCLSYQCAEGDAHTLPESGMLDRITARADEACRGAWSNSGVWSIGTADALM